MESSEILHYFVEDKRIVGLIRKHNKINSLYAGLGTPTFEKLISVGSEHSAVM